MEAAAEHQLWGGLKSLGFLRMLLLISKTRLLGICLQSRGVCVSALPTVPSLSFQRRPWKYVGMACEKPLAGTCRDGTVWGQGESWATVVKSNQSLKPCPAIQKNVDTGNCKLANICSVCRGVVGMFLGGTKEMLKSFLPLTSPFRGNNF